jgi:hypothetical protein
MGARSIRGAMNMAAVPAAVGLCLLVATAVGAQARPANTGAKVAQSSPGLPPKVAEPPAPASPAACDDLCVRRNADAAAQACVGLIEAQAPVDYDWLSRPFGGMFTQAEKPGKDGIIRYRGDAIRVLTAQNQWIRHSYECAWDPVKHKIVEARLRPGRLVPAADVANFIKNVIARSQTQQAVAQQHRAGARPLTTVVTPKPLAAKLPATAKRRHFGEPSRISISQAHSRTAAADSRTRILQAGGR